MRYGVVMDPSPVRIVAICGSLQARSSNRALIEAAVRGAPDGVVVTPPITENILEGITRRSAIELLKNELGLTVVERPIDRTEVGLADEFFMTGTAAQVVAITKVDHRPIGTGAMGPVVTKLRDMFEDIVRNRNPKYAHWNLAI